MLSPWIELVLVGRLALVGRGDGDPATAVARIVLRRPRPGAEVVRALTELEGVIEVATGEDGETE